MIRLAYLKKTNTFDLSTYVLIKFKVSNDHQAIVVRTLHHYPISTLIEDLYEKLEGKKSNLVVFLLLPLKLLFSEDLLLCFGLRIQKTKTNWILKTCKQFKNQAMMIIPRTIVAEP